MTGIEPASSGIESGRTVNRATTTAQKRFHFAAHVLFNEMRREVLPLL